jgi:hypothetical protein
MEHPAQVLLTLTLVILCCRTLAGQATPRRLASIFLVCPLLVMIRFEGLFVVFLLCVGFRRLSTIQHRHRIARRVVRNLFDSERRLRIAKLSAS